MRKALNSVVLVVVVAGALLLVPGVPGRWEKPAAAAPIVIELEWVHDSTLAIGWSPSTATAVCPANKVILGGGGWAHLVSLPSREVALTRLEPVEEVPWDPNRQGYIATAALTRPGELGERWRVHAYALCAHDLPGHHVVEDETDPSSSSRQEAAVDCPGGFRALGSGARINDAFNHDVLLQVVRASASGDITRAQAHEDVDGSEGTWSLTALAVCASVPQGYEVVNAESNERASESEKDATATCPDGKQMVSSGAAITNVAPANVSLQIVFPSSHLDEAQATAVENVPTTANWDFIVAQAICTY